MYGILAFMVAALIIAAIFVYLRAEARRNAALLRPHAEEAAAFGWWFTGSSKTVLLALLSLIVAVCLLLAAFSVSSPSTSGIAEWGGITWFWLLVAATAAWVASGLATEDYRKAIRAGVIAIAALLVGSGLYLAYVASQKQDLVEKAAIATAEEKGKWLAAQGKTHVMPHFRPGQERITRVLTGCKASYLPDPKDDPRVTLCSVARPDMCEDQEHPTLNANLAVYKNVSDEVFPASITVKCPLPGASAPPSDEYDE